MYLTYPREATIATLRSIQAESSLTRQVYESVRHSIISGRLVPGSLHSVQSMAQELGVSRTPVREALIDLAAQGMVRFERNRGVRILQTSAHDLEEIFAIRVLLEVPATYRAAEQFAPPDIVGLKKEFAAQEKAVKDHDRVSVAPLSAGVAERIGLAVDRRISVLNPSVVTST